MRTKTGKHLICGCSRVVSTILLLQNLFAAIPAAATETDTRPAEAASAAAYEETLAGRQKTPLTDNWKFFKGNAVGARSADFDDSQWQSVDLPHTWNAEDGQDGGNDYYRGDGWYRRTIPWDNAYQGKQLFIEFMGANTQTEVYVNGECAGIHKGGFTAFRFDITPYVTPGQDTLLAVKVNNASTQEIAPISADFTFFGGIYREVSLLALEPAAHVDVLDQGSNGLYLTTSEVSDEEATLNVRASIVNDTDEPQTVTVSAELRNPAPGNIKWIDQSLIPSEWLLFDPDDMTPGGTVQTVTSTLTIPENGSVPLEETITVENPHLWNGKTDPYRYETELTVRSADGEILDQVSDFVGFRYDEVDKDKGYFLNGKSYPLRGVNRHQDREDMGWAIETDEHAQDFALIYEIGANTIRLAHYPHADYFYDLCDMYGIVVWAEIPFVDQIGGSGSYEAPDAARAAFFDTTRQQLTELIRQQYNHPSIVCWGLQNEIRYGSFEGTAQKFLAELNDLAHNEDPTRFTTQAIYNATGSDTATWPSDVVSWNLYPGWYYSRADLFGEDADKRRAKDPDRPMGLSEYGYGSNIEHHTENVISPPKPAVDKYETLQTEEYQCWAHEKAWAAIEERDYLWATHVWNMFDFAVDKRNEAYRPGINNKGLVTYDRKIKKDVFYFYKANWSDQPFVHLNSSRFVDREQDKIQVKGYSNLDSAELVVNGVSCGTLTQQDLEQESVFIWKDITSATELIDSDAKTIALRNPLRAEQADSVFHGAVSSVTLEILQADGKTPVISGQVQPGMKLKVTGATHSETAVYTFVKGNLSTKQPAVSTSDYALENSRAELAVDGDSATRWTANLTPNASYPESVTVDLGQSYHLNRVETDWFTGTGTRCYYYTIEVSENGTDFITAADRPQNTTAGANADALENVFGRYVRITVTGNSDLAAKPTAAASLFELRVYGWNMDSDRFTLDHDTHTITIPAPENGAVSADEILQNLTLRGQVTAALPDSSDTIASGDRLLLTDDNNDSTVYTIVIESAEDNDAVTVTTYEKDADVYLFSIEFKRQLTDEQVMTAVYDENGKLLNVSLEKANGLFEQTVRLSASDETAYAKIFVWDDRMQPLGKAEKLTIE